MDSQLAYLGRLSQLLAACFNDGRLGTLFFPPNTMTHLLTDLQRFSSTRFLMWRFLCNVSTSQPCCIPISLNMRRGVCFIAMIDQSLNRGSPGWIAFTFDKFILFLTASAVASAQNPIGCSVRPWWADDALKRSWCELGFWSSNSLVRYVFTAFSKGYKLKGVMWDKIQMPASW